MDDGPRPSPPAHLWIAAIIGTVWNGFGAYDFVMTVTANPSYLAPYGTDIAAYLTSFPTWLVAFWALAVWGGLAGSLLLLARSKHAVMMFALSLVGLFVTSVYLFLLSAPPADLTTTSWLLIMLLIWAVAVGFFLYARDLQRRGVLGELN
jgi:hypothetical protein